MFTVYSALALRLWKQALLRLPEGIYETRGSCEALSFLQTRDWDGSCPRDSLCL